MSAEGFCRVHKMFSVMSAMKAYFFLVLTLAVVISNFPKITGASCSAPSNSPPRDSSGTRETGLFLDISSRVACNGTATAWHFCYYPTTSVQDNQLYAADIGLYREAQAFGIRWYQRIRREHVSRRGRDLSSESCETRTLQLSEQFNVMVGDIVGVCIYERGADDEDENNGEDSLVVVAETEPVLRYSLIHTSIQCSSFFASVPSVSSFSTVNDRALSVSLQIVSGITSGSSSLQPVAMSNMSAIHMTPTSSTLPATSLIPGVPGSLTPTSVNNNITVSSSPQSAAMDNTPAIHMIPTSSILPATGLIPGVPGQASSGRLTDASSIEPPIPISTQIIQYVDSAEEHTGIGQIIGMALGLVVATVVIFVALIGLCICIQKKWHSSKYQISNSARNRGRHCIGEDHFVRLHPFPYEEPTCTQKWKATVHVETNPLAPSIDELPNYAEFQFNTPGNIAHYEFDSEITNKQDYDKTAHLMSNGKHKNGIMFGQYSMLCEHYYKILEQATRGHQDCGDGYIAPAKNEEGLYDQFEKQKLNRIPRKEIIITGHLGSGQFGKVGKGVWSGPNGIINVAVKRLAVGAAKANRVKFLQEAAIMGQFLHPNVIQLFGVVVREDTVMIVMELGTKGDLQHYLTSMNPDPGNLVAAETSKILLTFSQQVAFGMQYLASKGFIHRDLAARNILVVDGNVLKIADFGMSRDLANEKYYLSQGGKIPVKWTAPEAIHYHKYSTASDIWSYGCLLYEIWSLGKKPFDDCSNSEALEKLDTGYRLPPPPGCPRVIYKLMVHCWHPHSSLRPDFRDALLQLMEPESKVLAIPDTDLTTHQSAGVLGSPMTAGERMYRDLQWKYFTPDEDEHSI